MLPLHRNCDTIYKIAFYEVITVKKILFIGAGNMACAIVNGIIKSGLVDAENIFLFDKNETQYSRFNSKCKKATELASVFPEADYVFLSVKPQNIKEILESITCLDYKRPVFVSICAGITIESIERALPGAKIVRTMPNTPLMLGQGVTAICRNSLVNDSDFDFAKSLFSSSGYVTEIQESDINALTAITSSSPAYIYLFAKSILDGAKALNFNYDDTLKMICYTLIGSANMMLTSDKSVDDLIRMVKSPNGTTEQALNVFDAKGFSDIVVEAMKACTNRAEELSKLN